VAVASSAAGTVSRRLRASPTTYSTGDLIRVRRTPGANIASLFSSARSVAQFGRRARRDELGQQFRGQERRGRGLLERDPHDVVAIEVAASAEDLLGSVVVVAGDIAEAPAALVPTGERAGGFADVVLGVVAFAEAEQFEQFAGVVFVRTTLDVLVAVEPDDHGRVARNVEQQRLERAERVAFERPQLLKHQRRAADLGVAGREVIVPEQRHPGPQRALGATHPQQPPAAQAFDVVPHRERLAEFIEFAMCTAVRFVAEQTLDRRLRPFVERATQFAFAAGKACPPQQVSGRGPVPRRRRGGLERS